MSETSQPSSENEKSKSKRPRGPRKRQVHNEVERRRKDKINGWISKIAELLPSKELHKQSKISILEQTVDYIKLLAAERDKLLSENRSEVQEEEVKKLKRDLKVIQEQNAVYEKLLQQANISVNSLPKKVLKYSGKFEKKNGVLSVKNTESDTCTRIDSAIQVSSDLILNIPNTNCIISNDTLKPPDTPVSKVAKTSAKNMQNGTKVQKIAPVSTVCSTVKSFVATSDINTRVSSCAVIPPLITQTVYQGSPITQESIVPIVNCNETLRNSASLHAGGVTTVLSQFPVMSTTHDSSFSSVCNKNVPTIIIPTGGSILQHFSAAEKPSNTISIICPSTLPILVPQQVINVSSMARNVGLPSTVLCPAPVNSHCSPVDKSALLSLTPSSVVPISSSIAANTRIILPSQATVLNNVCDNTLTPNAISALVNPVPQVPGDALIVPFVQKSSVVSSVNPPAKVNSSVTNASQIANMDFQNKTESSNTPLIESEKENSSLSSSKDLEISKEKEMLSSTILPSNSSSETPSSSKCTTESKKALMNRVINLSSNSPPSLQVLSANKIISLANQSQKVRTSLVFPLYQKSASKATSVSLQRNNDKLDHSPNNICLQIDTPGVSSNVTSNEKEPVNYNATKTTTPGTKFPDETPKSNFSLTVLMADGNDKINSNISQNLQESKSTHEMPILQTCVSSSNITSSATTSVAFPSIPVSEAIFDFVKRNNVFENASQNNASSKDLNSNSVIEKNSISKPNNEKNIGSNEPKFLDLNNVNVSLSVSSTSNVITDSHCSVANTSASGNTETSPCSSSDCSKLNQSSSLCYNDNSASLKCINPLQNVMPQSSQSSNLNTSAHIDTIGPAFHDNGTFIMNDNTLNQNILPSLFSNSQIVTLNTPIFVCSSGQENTESVLLSQNLHVTNEIATTVNSYMLSNPVSSFSTLNKDSVLSNTFPTISTCTDTAKSSARSDTNAAVSDSTNTPVENLRSKSNVLSIIRSNKSLNSSDSECSKSVSKKKAKSMAKTNRSSVNDTKNVNCESISEINSNFDISKSQSVEKSSSFAKDASGCMRQDSTNFLFTSDILARATESIFGNDVLETNHIPKRDAICFSEESSNVNNSSSVSSKLEESSFKVQNDEVRDHMVMESASSVASDNTKKSDAANDMHNLTISTCVENIKVNNENMHDMNQKLNRSCRIRKPKTSAENEPPSKKLKEASDVPNKFSGTQNFNNSKQSENNTEKQSDTVGQSNISCPEKQASSESSSPGVDQSGIDSIGNFNNQIHLSENICKTPSSVDAIFSLTPMLGDILKDVSHGINVESRNSGFLPCNDNQTLFSTDKNFISFNYVNNSNEEYLSLPRMYFPIIPEITAAPVVPATNVSFAHSVSLCSTQSVSLKTTETLSSSESPGKTDPKKKTTSSDIHNSLPNSLSQELSSTNTMAKQSECILKFSESEPQFSIGSSKVSNNGSLLFDTQSTDVHATNINVTHSNLVVPQSESNFNTRDNFMPIVSHGVTFYPSLSSSSSIQNFVSSSSSAVSHSNYHCNNANSMVSMPYSVQASSTGSNTSSFTSQSAMSKADSLSHSLCSLLKETTNILAENRTGSTGAVSSQSINSSSSANISQSKYSALSLIADQTFSEPVSSAACHSDYGQNSMTCTTSSSEMQFAASSSCSRNQRSSLSYSAESLIQTSCANSEKNKNKNAANSRYQHRSTEKKNDRNSMTSLHNITDTNIFMPVSNCDINIQNAPLVPLPPVTSFHNFPSSYTMCESVPSTTIFNSVSRSHDIALSLSNDNFLNHMNLTVESQMLNNRHDMSSAVPKPSNSITLPFENHGSLYNNCNFLPPVKPTLENSRASESNACFQPASFNNSYPQQSQKPNCCHFSHRTIATNPELTGDMNLPVVPPVASFHTEKNNFQGNRSSLQTTFTQSNANYVGNFFYNPAANARDINDMTVKPSNLRTSQETFVPEGVRQNIHDHNAGIIFNSRKSVSSSRSKSKKVKNNNINESNMNVIPNSMVNFCATQEVSCSKANLSCVPNGYFKNNTHSVIPPPGQLSCSQNKISESATNTVIPANPSFNSVLHQQGDTFLNLNFQPSNFTMSPLPRPPTQPLSCSCITTPIISHTFSSTAHPVPNFNLSNILPDMGCSANQVSLSPVKFPPMNHALPSSSAQCQANPTITNSAHIVSHQSCAPALYPPHPPMVRNTLNPILSHNPQSLSDSQVSLVGGSGSSMIPQNTTFSATQNPTFRNVIHSLAFPRSDR